MTTETIGTVCKRFSSGKGIAAKSIQPSGLYPVIGANGLRGYTGTFNFDGRCAVIGRQGAYCGNVRYFEGKAFMTEHAIVAEANENNDSGYLAYKLQEMNLAQYQSQSAQPGLSVNTLSSVRIEMPDLQTQVKVFNILHKLDDKISNNNVISSQLETLAETIYDYWFLQFEFPNEEGKPYKSSGGKMVWNEELKREIPEGWEASKLLDISHYIDNTTNVNSVNKDNYIGTDNMLNDMKGVTQSEYVPTVGNITKYMVNDILIANIRPYFKKIWLSDREGGCSADVLCIRANDKVPSEFIYATLAKDLFFDYDMAGSKGSKMPRGDKKHIMDYPIAYNQKIASLFSNKISKMYEEVHEIYRENQQLTSLRDFLLPLLMNGQVIFKDEATSEEE